jgi:hypothetical protein
MWRGQCYSERLELKVTEVIEISKELANGKPITFLKYNEKNYQSNYFTFEIF